MNHQPDTERRERYKAAMQNIRVMRDGKNEDRRADAVMAVADQEQQRLLDGPSGVKARGERIWDLEREIARLGEVLSHTKADCSRLDEECDRLRTQAAEVRAAAHTEPDVRQVLVHPVVWPHLEAWLAGRGIELARIPVEDDLPTYAMTPTDAHRAAAARPVCVHPEGYDGECPCPPACICCAAARPDDTTGDRS